MAIKSKSPTNPASRAQTFSTFEEITRSKPEKALTEGKKRIGGRNNQGQQTIWFRGGGHKRRYRRIDFKRDKHGVGAKVAEIEYDPNRSARIALLHYADGEKRYILWPLGLQVGDTVEAGETAEVHVGNALPLHKIPLGTQIHNIELRIGQGGQMVRAAGRSDQLLAKESQYAQIKLPSGEVRRVHLSCYATIGQVGNLDHENVSVGKAGRKRRLGRRPHNRGVVMNPVDHPHGGGEGKSPIGHPSPKSPWGKPTLGHRTRGKKDSDRMIVRRRYE